MSYGFGDMNAINKAQAAYKDGGGMGGGGMYFQQRKKRKEEEQDLFEHSEEKKSSEISYDSDIPEEEIPQDSMFNKFVNWFRINHE